MSSADAAHATGRKPADRREAAGSGPCVSGCNRNACDCGCGHGHVCPPDVSVTNNTACSLGQRSCVPCGERARGIVGTQRSAVYGRSRYRDRFHPLEVQHDEHGAERRLRLGWHACWTNSSYQATLVENLPPGQRIESRLGAGAIAQINSDIWISNKDRVHDGTLEGPRTRSSLGEKSGTHLAQCGVRARSNRQGGGPVFMMQPRPALQALRGCPVHRPDTFNRRDPDGAVTNGPCNCKRRQD